MYPMKLQPVYKDYLWGGQKLREKFGKQSPLEPLAESWEISCHPEGLSRIAEGTYQGRTLQDVLKEKGDSWIGRLNPTPGHFPVLVKWIDAAQPLSIQVHPSDEKADADLGEQGKAEMWYILDAAPGASIYYGLKRPLSEKEFLKHAQNGSLREDLNCVEVHPGESYYIMPGTIHALGKGILVAEVQQNSNTTFRIDDYGRLDPQGKPRPLHLERAAQTADLTPILPKGEPNTSLILFPGFSLIELFRCQYFRVIRLDLDDSILLDCDETSFHAFLWLEGKATLWYQDHEYALSSGESCFLPAGLGVYEVRGQGKALLIRL